MNRLVIRKWLAGGVSVSAAAGLWIGAALVRPSVSKAITAVEMPAYVFPEVTFTSGQKLMVCTNNLLGDGSVRALIGLLDVADSSRLVPGTTTTSVALDAHRGGCALLLPAVRPTVDALTAVPVTTGIPAVFLIGLNSASGGGGGAGRGLISSAQVVEADGSVRLLITPTLMERVGLPAVQ
jgi:hypothetical protein